MAAQCTYKVFKKTIVLAESMAQPLVSVLMTAWNRENYLPEAIQSVLESSYKNFELIICDDCSSDNTVTIANKFAESDSRIKVYRNDKNLGDYNNRNRAASYANGRYLKYLDSDDRIYPHSLELMVNCMEQFPEAAFAFEAAHIHLTRPTLQYPMLFQPAESFREHFLNSGFFYSGPSSVIFRADNFKEFNGFSGRRFMSDLELMFKIALRYPVLILQPGLVWLRTEGEREGLAEFATPAILGERYKLVISFLNQSPLSTEEKRKAMLSLDKVLARHILRRFFLQLKPAEAAAIKRSSALTYTGLLRAFHLNRIF